MNRYRLPAQKLADILPYDPKFRVLDTVLSANESPYDVPQELKSAVRERIEKVNFNRYPDPLANTLRDLIAKDYGLKREQILVGNGGDELLFNFTLAWGGVGRTFLNFPPTFSVYEHNARITDTQIVNIPLLANFAIDEEAVFARLAKNDIDFMIITTPNNPTGNCVDESFVLQLLDSTDAMVLVDEAYFEFAGVSFLPYLEQHKNLIIVRTLSKAYSLAGVRLGYIFAHEEVINELIKVRQPYSVDAISQAIGECVFEQRALFEAPLAEIVAQRDFVFEKLKELKGVEPYPSSANFILFKVKEAFEIWNDLCEQGILIRDPSEEEGLKNCLRVTIGTPQDNQRFLEALEKSLAKRGNL
ncbi:MAG: histidinol-phosphate transaminase [Eggerthellaceae bacterium]|jgi:histidinol-phosphate aminotransferase|nr:histidinol-phosphate transaminase [Eggerthellaceae bacterium]MDR2721810.1 histidinol-phosphate transaminase [Coriobacteriaceae bacterium]